MTESTLMAEAAIELQALELADYVSGDLAQPRWAVQSIWPDGAMGVIGGRPKDGKSTLAAELAVSLWSGTPMFALSNYPVRARSAHVLYVQQENADHRVQRDLQQILAARGLGEIEELGSVGEESFSRFTMMEPPPDVEMPIFSVLSHQRVDLSSGAYQDELERRILHAGYRYLILDPLYNLVGGTKIGDGGDELRPILSWLTHVKNDLGCAPIVTHHMTDKSGDHGAAALLGSTYVHAWYEAALFTKADEHQCFTVTADALRDIGTVERHSLLGLGVGSWMRSDLAQGVRASDGRGSPSKASAINRRERLIELEAENPDWTDTQYASELGVAVRTVERYRSQLAVDAEDATQEIRS
jgi:hypothetical protein